MPHPNIKIALTNKFPQLLHNRRKPIPAKAGQLSRQGVPLARIDRRQTGDQQIPRIGEKPLQLLTGNFAVLQLRAESRQLRRPAAADELA